MKKLSILFFISISLSVSAQQDHEWLKINRYKIAVLSDSLNENSGLEFFNNRLFTINDGGNSSEIFEINRSTGKIDNVFKTNLINKDWEAIASDSIHLYIGDFGNNVGARKDLMIYQIPLNDSLDLNSIKEIPFFYPERQEFIPKNLNNDFDAEAMIVLNEKIHVFTKEWASKSTTHYTIDPAIAENQPAQKVESYAIGYVVTDAAYFENKLYLIGYTKKAEVFITVFTESEPGIFFTEKPKKYYLGSSLSLGQIEGIAVDSTGLYISGEEFNLPIIKVKPYLYFISLEKLK